MSFLRYAASIAVRVRVLVYDLRLGLEQELGEIKSVRSTEVWTGSPVKCVYSIQCERLTVKSELEQSLDSECELGRYMAI